MAVPLSMSHKFSKQKNPFVSSPGNEKARIEKIDLSSWTSETQSFNTRTLTLTFLKLQVYICPSSNLWTKSWQIYKIIRITFETYNSQQNNIVDKRWTGSHFTSLLFLFPSFKLLQNEIFVSLLTTLFSNDIHARSAPGSKPNLKRNASFQSNT